MLLSYKFKENKSNLDIKDSRASIESENSKNIFEKISKWVLIMVTPYIILNDYIQPINNCFAETINNSINIPKSNNEKTKIKIQFNLYENKINFEGIKIENERKLTINKLILDIQNSYESLKFPKEKMNSLFSNVNSIIEDNSYLNNQDFNFRISEVYARIKTLKLIYNPIIQDLIRSLKKEYGKSEKDNRIPEEIKKISEKVNVPIKLQFSDKKIENSELKIIRQKLNNEYSKFLTNLKKKYYNFLINEYKQYCRKFKNSSDPNCLKQKQELEKKYETYSKNIQNSNEAQKKLFELQKKFNDIERKFYESFDSFNSRVEFIKYISGLGKIEDEYYFTKHQRFKKLLQYDEKVNLDWLSFMYSCEDEIDKLEENDDFLIQLGEKMKKDIHQYYYYNDSRYQYIKSSSFFRVSKSSHFRLY